MRQPERRFAAIAPLLAAALLALLAGCAAGTGASGGNVRPAADEDQRAAAVQVELGQGYLAQGDLETARDRLRRALELDPNSVDAHTLMAVLHERIRRPALAEKFYRRAVELKPEDGSVNNNYGTFLCGIGRFAEAQTHFERAVADPFYRTPAVAYANAGFCSLKAGDNARAERWLRSALELEPRNAGVLLELARLSLASGEQMRARAFLQRYEAIAAVSADSLELGARIEERIGDRAASVRYRDALREKFPDFVPSTEQHGSGSR